MYIGMAPLTAMAAIISEEKECNTLRCAALCLTLRPENIYWEPEDMYL